MITAHFPFNFEVALRILTYLSYFKAPNFVWILSVDNVTFITVQGRAFLSMVSAAISLARALYRTLRTSVFHSHFNIAEFMCDYYSRSRFPSQPYSSIFTLIP